MMKKIFNYGFAVAMIVMLIATAGYGAAPPPPVPPPPEMIQEGGSGNDEIVPFRFEPGVQSTGPDVSLNTFLQGGIIYENM
jgi:hypothetical protein